LSELQKQLTQHCPQRVSLSAAEAHTIQLLVDNLFYFSFSISISISPPVFHIKTHFLFGRQDHLGATEWLPFSGLKREGAQLNQVVIQVELSFPSARG